MGLAEDSISPNLMLHWFISPLTCPFLRMYPIFRHIQRGHQVSSFFFSNFYAGKFNMFVFFLVLIVAGKIIIFAGEIRIFRGKILRLIG